MDEDAASAILVDADAAGVDEDDADLKKWSGVIAFDHFLYFLSHFDGL